MATPPDPPRPTRGRRTPILTPEQLARKRTTDRDAQRSRRARTRAYIEQLESEIEALKANRSDDVESEIDRLVHENKILEENIRDIRATIQSRRKSVHDYLERDCWGSDSTAVPDLDVPDPIVTEDDIHSHSSNAASPTSPARRDVDTAFEEEGHGKHQRRGTVGAGKLVRQPSHAFWQYPLSILSPATMHDQMILNLVQECRRVPRTRSLDVLGAPVRLNIKQLIGYSPQSLLQPGLSSSGPIEVRPAKDGPATNHPATDWMVALCDQVGIGSLLERLSTIPIILPLVAWLSFPDAKSYQRVTAALRPTTTQCTVAHSLWVDWVVWPRLRDAIIRRPDVYDTGEFASLYGQSHRLANWPPDKQAVGYDADTGDMWLTPEFTAHAKDARNYRIAPMFFQRYPELRAYARVSEVDDSESG